jgi:hypothetical protein
MTLTKAKGALQDYHLKRQKPGGFLTCILSNDLIGAVRKADEDSRKIVVEIVKHCWNELPGDIWGSPEKVENHLEGPQKIPTPPEGIDREI